MSILTVAVIDIADPDSSSVDNNALNPYVRIRDAKAICPYKKESYERTAWLLLNI